MGTSAFRSLAVLGAALVVAAVLLGVGSADLHERLPIQVPSRRFLRGVALVAVALVGIGLAGVALAV